MQKKASLRLSTVNNLVFSEILINIVIRIGHEGRYRDHCVIYYPKVLYHPIVFISLNNWQNRNVAQRLAG